MFGILRLMNKLIPFSRFTKVDADRRGLLADASVVVSDNRIPLGFFFGRDTFISLMTVIDEQFEKTAASKRNAYDNFAGKIIDLIEEKLPVDPNFVSDLRLSIKQAKENGWVPLSEIRKSI